MGCILAELLGGRPFFKGRDYVDQLNQILHYLGTPNEETLSRIGSPRAQEYVRNLPFMAKVSFARLFPNANPDALDLLDRMLAFDPSSRISVEEALEHRYLHIWHDASDEPNCPRTFDFAFEVVEDVPEMRKMILEEVQRFRTHVRQQPHQAIAGGKSSSPLYVRLSILHPLGGRLGSSLTLGAYLSLPAPSVLPKPHLRHQLHCISTDCITKAPNSKIRVCPSLMTLVSTLGRTLVRKRQPQVQHSRGVSWRTI